MGATLTGLSAANAAAAAGSPTVTSVSVTDTAADVQANLDALETVALSGKLGMITLTDIGTPTLTITEAQLTNDQAALARIATFSGFDVTNATAADALSIAKMPAVVGVAVSDSAADVANNIAALETVDVADKLTAIALTDGGTPTISLTYPQHQMYIAVLLKIAGPYSVSFLPVISATLPQIGASFDPATARKIKDELNKLLPADAAPNVATIAVTFGQQYDNATAPGTLNVFVYAPGRQGGEVAIPADFKVGYATDPHSLLDGSVGSDQMLIGAAANLTLAGAPGDTVYGGDGNATLAAAGGNETLIGGTDANLFTAGSGHDVIMSQGRDTITGGGNGSDTITASGTSALISGSGAALDVIGKRAALTVDGADTANTVTGGSGTQLIFGTTSLVYTGGSGAATVVGGLDANTVTGGGGSLLVFANGVLKFTGGSGGATVVGGHAPIAATLGAGGAVFAGAAAGNALATGAGSASLVGGSTGGDTLTATGSGNDLLVAGSGPQVLDGSAATGNLTLFGGSGAGTVAGGSGNDLLVAGSGSATLSGGGGNNDYLFFASPGTSRVETITDFDPNRNAIGLYGFSAGADASALASAGTPVGGGMSVTLSDGTKIVFAGGASLHSYNFF